MSERPDLGDQDRASRRAAAKIRADGDSEISRPAGRPISRLDVVIPTYRRPQLLRALLQSLAQAQQPAALEVAVRVVDNAPDGSAVPIVHDFASTAPWFSICCLTERRRGSSAARNAGLARSTADFVAFLDDDERVSPGWFRAIERTFEDPHLAFASGPYVGDWHGDRPAWYSGKHCGVVGEIGVDWVDHELTGEGKSMLLGGNAVIRRSALDRIGGFNETLGRGPDGTGQGEDSELFHRLLKHGERGRWVGQISILHHIPEERLTRQYHRRWMRKNGAACAQIDAISPPNVPMVLGIPRHLLGALARDARQLIGSLSIIGRAPAVWFDFELGCHFLAGYACELWRARKLPRQADSA